MNEGYEFVFGDGVIFALGILVVLKFLLIGGLLLFGKYSNPERKISREMWFFIISYALGLFTSFIVLGILAIVIRIS